MDYKNKYLKYKEKYQNLKNSISNKYTFTDNLLWRRAEKHFLPGPVDIKPIMNAIVNSPSSYGIQPFKVILIIDPKTKLSLKPACYGQSQIEECYALFIFCALKDLDKRIDSYVSKTGFYQKKESMIKFLNNQPSKTEWSKHQAYLALGYALAAASERKIASCPMEGFEHEKISQVLNLDDDLVPCVLFTVGNKKDGYPLEKRFRFPVDDLFKVIN
jgi:nitroreductase